MYIYKFAQLEKIRMGEDRQLKVEEVLEKEKTCILVHFRDRVGEKRFLRRKNTDPLPGCKNKPKSDMYTIY
jgi:hypothetical protein